MSFAGVQFDWSDLIAILAAFSVVVTTIAEVTWLKRKSERDETELSKHREILEKISEKLATVDATVDHHRDTLADLKSSIGKFDERLRSQELKTAAASH